MTLRATLERIVPGGTDDYGQTPAAPIAWALLAANVPTWFWNSAKLEAITTDKTAVVEDLRAIVPIGTDVTEKDRVNGIADQRGIVRHAGLLQIESVVDHRDHLELVLRSVGP